MLKGIERCGLALPKRLGARQANDRRRDAAVRDACAVDAVAGHGQADCGGEGGDVEVFAARDLVELIADDGEANARKSGFLPCITGFSKERFVRY